MTPPLVIGYGNTLRGDDGAGASAALRVQEEIPDVDVLILHDLQPEVAESLTHRRLVIFLDAAAGAERLLCEPLEASSDVPPVESHLFSPAQLLVLCKTVYGTIPESVYLIGIPASDFSYREGLSPQTASLIDGAVALVRQLLNDVASGRPPIRSNL